MSLELYDVSHACDSSAWEGGKTPGLPGKQGEILSQKSKKKVKCVQKTFSNTRRTIKCPDPAKHLLGKQVANR